MHDSQLITLQQIIDQQLLFNIPIYQRLYVWGAEQIKILLDDLLAAHAGDKEVFYLGGTLVIEQAGGTGSIYDLIDGQQRITTLWLLSIALQRLTARRRKDELNHLADYRHARVGEQLVPRIRFAIRPEVSAFFDALLHSREIPDAPSANTLSHAITEIETYFGEHPGVCLTSLSHFVAHRVQLVLTTVPPNTDLNKLFEVINNRGMQLQHHEILKARLLAQVIDQRQRAIYGQLWDACSHMDDYVEKNLRAVTGLKLVPLFDGTMAAQGREALANPELVRAALTEVYRAREGKPLTLAEILGNPDQPPPDQPTDLGDESYESDPVRSIVTFPMLLQHVLRIHLSRRDGSDIDKVLDKELLAIFQTHWLDTIPSGTEQSSAEVMRFIDLLWECRYLFDKHVIKWIEDDDDTVHAIRRLRLSKSNKYQSLVREGRESDLAMAMLQSMLYHSQQLTTHYWLTPFIHYLLQHGGEQAHLYLKFLDNHLLCTSSDAPLIERTRQFLRQPWQRDIPLRDISAVLGASHGTGFSHYWFYKLEYILWEKYRLQKGSAWQAFRMTAKNSVEHVSPQNPETYDSNRVSPDKLDTFGNLALISRSINSEFGNKPYLVKRAHFHERNVGRVDSLKLALIYENATWNNAVADLHREQMVTEYLEYLNSVDDAV
jgi:hypothetical protein